MLSHKQSGGLTNGLEIEGAGHVPSPADFQGMEKRLIDDPVKVGFAFGGEAGVKLCGCLLHGKDAYPRGKVEVERAEQGFRGVGAGHLAGGHLGEGVDATVGPSGSGHVKGFAENLFESGLEGELNRGVGVLALPAVEIGTAVSDGEFEGLKFQGGT